MKPNLNTPIEVTCAAALNEQGYLLQHKLAKLLESSTAAEHHHNWRIEAEEVPVSLMGGEETRVDLLLRHGVIKSPEWRVIVEAKRAAKDFKHWVFFGRSERQYGPSTQKYYIESASLSGGWIYSSETKPPMSHGLNTYDASIDCETYDYGIEARVEINKEKKTSATTTIEDALYQVTLGQASVAAHLRHANVLGFNLIPVIVTTADIYSAVFSVNDVSLDTGKIDPQRMQVAPKRWLATNYHINDVISGMSQFTINRASDLGETIALRQVRTVFVVRSSEIQPFLKWLDLTFCTLR